MPEDMNAEIKRLAALIKGGDIKAIVDALTEDLEERVREKAARRRERLTR